MIYDEKDSVNHKKSASQKCKFIENENSGWLMLRLFFLHALFQNK